MLRVGKLYHEDVFPLDHVIMCTEYTTKHTEETRASKNLLFFNTSFVRVQKSKVRFSSIVHSFDSNRVRLGLIHYAGKNGELRAGSVLQYELRRFGLVTKPMLSYRLT